MWYTNMDFSRGTFMIRKFVDRSNWIRVTKFKDKTLKIKDKNFDGYIYGIYVEQANKKFEVSYGDENFLILDDGYTWIQIIPTSKHYTVTIMYNNEKEIVQWYIDITNMNGIDSDERIFYDDLYLDVVITKNRNVILINEDKINSALNNFVITSEQYKNAYREARDIMDKITKEGMEKIEVKSKKILDKFNF